jgi:flagellar basal-body rod protein FlgB
MEASRVSNYLYQYLDFRAQNQKVIANNIANINTPMYKTKALSFEAHLQPQLQDDLSMKMTNSTHIMPQKRIEPSTLKMYEPQGLEEQNDGNNVNLDVQISEMSKNSVMFNAIQSAIKKDHQWFKLVIDASAKN